MDVSPIRRNLNLPGGREASSHGFDVAMRVAALPEAKATEDDAESLLVCLPGMRSSCNLKRPLAVFAMIPLGNGMEAAPDVSSAPRVP